MSIRVVCRVFSHIKEGDITLMAVTGRDLRAVLLNLKQFCSFALQRDLGASESFVLSQMRGQAGIFWDLTNCACLIP